MKSFLLAIHAVIGLSFLLCSPLCVARETIELGTSFQIQGTVPDMQQQIESSGYTFRVALRDINYSGKICRTLVEPTAVDRMTVWVAMQDAELTIHRTNIDGRRHSAQCGPLTVVLGNRRELWIGFEVERNKEGNVEPLKLLRTRFRLPRDNWSVGSPSWVKTSGIGMTEGKVVSGLRKGLSNRVQSVESQLIGVAPEIFSQVQNAIVDDLKSQDAAISKAVDRNQSATDVIASSVD